MAALHVKYGSSERLVAGINSVGSGRSNKVAVRGRGVLDHHLDLFINLDEGYECFVLVAYADTVRERLGKEPLQFKLRLPYLVEAGDAFVLGDDSALTFELDSAGVGKRVALALSAKSAVAAKSPESLRSEPFTDGSSSDLEITQTPGRELQVEAEANRPRRSGRISAAAARSVSESAHDVCVAPRRKTLLENDSESAAAISITRGPAGVFKGKSLVSASSKRKCDLPVYRRTRNVGGLRKRGAAGSVTTKRSVAAAEIERTSGASDQEMEDADSEHRHGSRKGRVSQRQAANHRAAVVHGRRRKNGAMRNTPRSGGTGSSSSDDASNGVEEMKRLWPVNGRSPLPTYAEYLWRCPQSGCASLTGIRLNYCSGCKVERPLTSHVELVPAPAAVGHDAAGAAGAAAEAKCSERRRGDGDVEAKAGDDVPEPYSLPSRCGDAAAQHARSNGNDAARGPPAPSARRRSWRAPPQIALHASGADGMPDVSAASQEDADAAVVLPGASQASETIPLPNCAISKCSICGTADVGTVWRCRRCTYVNCHACSSTAACSVCGELALRQNPRRAASRKLRSESYFMELPLKGGAFGPNFGIVEAAGRGMRNTDSEPEAQAAPGTSGQVGDAGSEVSEERGREGLTIEHAASDSDTESDSERKAANRAKPIAGAASTNAAAVSASGTASRALSQSDDRLGSVQESELLDLTRTPSPWRDLDALGAAGTASPKKLRPAAIATQEASAAAAEDEAAAAAAAAEGATTESDEELECLGFQPPAAGSAAAAEAKSESTGTNATALDEANGGARSGGRRSGNSRQGLQIVPPLAGTASPRRRLELGSSSAAAAIGEGWACSQCTLWNKPRARKCRTCGLDKVSSWNLLPPKRLPVPARNARRQPADAAALYKGPGPSRVGEASDVPKGIGSNLQPQAAAARPTVKAASALQVAPASDRAGRSPTKSLKVRTALGGEATVAVVRATVATRSSALLEAAGFDPDGGTTSRADNQAQAGARMSFRGAAPKRKSRSSPEGKRSPRRLRSSNTSSSPAQPGSAEVAVTARWRRDVPVAASRASADLPASASGCETELELDEDTETDDSDAASEASVGY